MILSVNEADQAPGFIVGRRNAAGRVAVIDGNLV